MFSRLLNVQSNVSKSVINSYVTRYFSPPKLIRSTRNQRLNCCNIYQSFKKPLKLTAVTISCISIKLSSNDGVKEKEFQINVERKKEPLGWWIILKMLLDDIWSLIGAVGFTLYSAFLNTLIPIYLGKIVNAMSGLIKNGESIGTHFQDLKSTSLYLVGLYLLQAMSTVAYISLLSTVGEHLALNIRFQLFKSIINQDVEFFDTQRTGELIDILTNDVQEFKSSFKTCLSQGLRSTSQIFGCVITLFCISPFMTGTMVIIIPSVIVVGSLLGSLLRKISHEAQAQAVKCTNMIEEVFSNVRTVKSFSNEDLESQLYLKEIEETSRLNILLGTGIGMFQGGTNLFLNSVILGTLYIGSHLISDNQLSPGDLMSFLVATQTIQRSFAQLSLTFGSALKFKITGNKILQYIQMEPKIALKGGFKLSQNSFVPNIEFKNVTFSYPSRTGQVVLNDLSMSLPAGKTVAIVGTSGNGKSTIVALLERFYDVDQGAITVNGIDIRDLDVSWLRKSALGLINQEPTLFAKTVRENIRYGRPNASDEEVYEAARLANADNFVRNFPDGYDTVLGERGLSVSGGQKQRIALARVLLKNPPILILDEATSALDPESEKVVQATLENVCFGRTVLVIAHRLSTIQNADLILVLKNGVIVESGSHESLCAKKGHYYNLMMQQGTLS